MVTPFVGRRTELDTVLDALASVDTDGLQIATVIGEPGIGKTRLLAAVTSAAASAGATVLQGGITATEATLAWAGVATLVRTTDPAWFDAVPPLPRRALLTALGRGEDESPVAAHQVAHGLAGLLDAASVAGAVVVVVDDVQWLDHGSAAALSFAVRALVHRPLLVVLSWRRDEPVPVDVDHLVGQDRVRRVELTGLSVAALRQVVREEAGTDLRRPVLSQIHERTGGNPLHALELARLLTPDGRLEQTVPPSLRASIAVHLGALTQEARAVLTSAALMATPTMTVLDVLHPHADVLLEQAEQLRVVTVEAGGVSFTHPLLAAALVDGLGGLTRRNLHRRLADVVDDPEERALHLAAASEGPDEVVAAALEEAGLLARRRGAPELAAERLEAALDRTPRQQGAAWERRAVVAVEAALDAGSDEVTVRIAREALATSADPGRVAQIGAAAAMATSRREGTAAARALVEPLLDRLTEHPGPRSRLLRSMARLLPYDDLRAAVEAAEQALSAAQQAGDALAIVDAERLLESSRCLLGQHIDLEGLRRAASGSSPGTAHGASWFLAELLVWCDLHADAEVYLGDLLARSRASGDIAVTINSLSQLGDSARRSGRWPEAEARLREVLDLARVLGIEGAVTQEVDNLAWVLAAQGSGDEAVTLIGQHGRPRSRLDAVHRSARAGFVALAAGRIPEAVQLLVEAHANGEALGLGDPRGLPFRADLAEALIATGRLDEAGAVVEWLRVAATTAGSARATAEAFFASGLLAGATGDLAAADRALEQAAERADAIPLPFEAARALLALGSVRRRAGQRTQARAALDVARAGFERLGARPWIERTTAELSRLGDRLAAGTAPSDLTPTERQVASLVAEGRTNAEVAAELFVSLRTVESNLTRVYRKLGVRSRTELVARLRA